MVGTSTNEKSGNVTKINFKKINKFKIKLKKKDVETKFRSIEPMFCNMASKYPVIIVQSHNSVRNFVT